jgi:hypothetical protein
LPDGGKAGDGLGKSRNWGMKKTQYARPLESGFFKMFAALRSATRLFHIRIGVPICLSIFVHEVSTAILGGAEIRAQFRR